MYSRSRRTQSENSLISLRPLICHRQVRPGLTLRRRRWARSSKRLVSSTGSGLGPTRLIAPLRTLNNWGSSSRLNRRRNRPIGVMRGSLATLNTGPLISFMAANSCLRCSALVPIERNLYMVNGRPLMPLRFCRNRIGPGEVIFTARAHSSSTGESSTSMASAPPKSMACLARPCSEAAGAE